MKTAFVPLLLLPLLLTACGSAPNELAFVTDGKEGKTLYDDSYFLLDNQEFHQEIALASAATSLAGIDGNPDYSKRHLHLFELWEKEGFKDPYVNEDYKTKPSADSIGFGFAHKTVDDFELVAVTVRSGAYEAEWASNLTLGGSGNSQGYDQSSDKLLADLKAYLAGNRLSGKTRFWFSGYSRGAAVINLSAAKMLDDIVASTFDYGTQTTTKDVYAYGLETPLAAGIDPEKAKGDPYRCIHNVLNFNDPVTTLSPHAWGFVRYGVSHYFPDRLTDIRFDAVSRKKMVSDYHFSPDAHLLPEYNVDDWKFYDPGFDAAMNKNLPRETLNPSMGRFTRAFMDQLATIPITREFFAQGYQEGVRELILAAMGANPEIKGLSINGGMFVNMIFSYPFIQSMFIELQQEDYDGFANDFELLLFELFDVDGDSVSPVRAVYDKVYWFLLLLCTGITSRADLMLQFFSRDNLLNLFSTHDSGMNYSFLRSCDARLYGKNALQLNDGTYRVLHIDEPTSVALFEENLGKAAFSYKDGVMGSGMLCCEKLNDGSLNVFLPNNGAFRYVIHAASSSLGKVDEYGQETPLPDALGTQGRI